MIFCRFIQFGCFKKIKVRSEKRIRLVVIYRTAYKTYTLDCFYYQIGEFTTVIMTINANHIRLQTCSLQYNVIHLRNKAMLGQGDTKIDYLQQLQVLL